ncbi:MAG: hypothetical protein J6K40_01370 [Alistipes sp.]|nr:hypothetical protein [Alistipes sp.]
MILMLVGCYNAADKPIIEDNLPRANSTVAELKRDIGRGTDRIMEPITLRGRITSSDEEKNFYSSFMVEDLTGAVEVMVGYPTLFGLYPEGLEVALTIEGCAVIYTRGVLQIGRRAEQSSLYGIDYLESRERVDEVVHSGISVEPITAKDIDIRNVTPDICGRLVRIDSLSLVASSSIDTLTMTLDDAVWRGTALYTDPRSDSLTIYTRDYATFADNALPHTLRSVTGIIESGEYDGHTLNNLKMRYESDAVAY